MPYYESVFIARPDISAAQVEALTESMKEIVTGNGGAVTRTEYWGLKSLAYRIKKSRKGHYSLMNLDAPAEAVKELERNLLLNEDVIRFMTIKVDELEEEPSAMMRNKGSRDDRPRRDRDDRGRGDRDDRGRGDRDDRGRGDREDRPRGGNAESTSDDEKVSSSEGDSR